VPTAIEADIALVSERALMELEVAVNEWQQQWRALDEDFRRLGDHAKYYVGSVEDRLVRVDEFLERSSSEALADIGKDLVALSSKLERIVGRRGDVIEKALQESSEGGWRRSLAPTIGLVVGISLGVLVVWKGIVPADWNLAPFQAGLWWLAGAGCLGVAVETARRLFMRRASLESIFMSNYRVERDGLNEDLKGEIENSLRQVDATMSERNERIRAELQAAYGAVIKDFEKARATVVPTLEEQLMVAAKLSENTTATMTSISERAVDTIESTVTARLNRVCEDIETDVRTTFSQLATSLGVQYVEMLERYSLAFHSTARGVAAVRAAAQRELAGLAGTAAVD
jgi:hypothetical protein